MITRRYVIAIATLRYLSIAMPVQLRTRRVSIPVSKLPKVLAEIKSMQRSVPVRLNKKKQQEKLRTDKLL